MENLETTSETQSIDKPSTIYAELKEIADGNSVDWKEFTERMQKLNMELPKHTEQAIDFNDPEQSKVINLGFCDVPISELLESKDVVELLAEMEGQGKEGKSSAERVEWVSQNRDMADKDDYVYLYRLRDSNGEFYWQLGGGRHRLAADIIADKKTIRANVKLTTGFFSGELGQKELARLESLKTQV
jgi:hypothetical protein